MWRQCAQRRRDLGKNKGAIIMKATQRVLFFLVMALVLVAAPVSASSIPSEVLYYVNVERAAAGLTPVELDRSMISSAAIRAQEAQVRFM